MKTTKTYTMLVAVIFAMATLACSPSRPEAYADVDASAAIYPDFAGATIPCNIAPLNFTILESGDDYFTEISIAGDNACNLRYKGSLVDIDTDDWHKLLDKAKGSDLEVEIFVRNDGQWRRFSPVTLHVATDSIDPYISYRLIEPSYINFETMRINQRCIENFDESEIYNNCAFAAESDGQCINCHSYQNYNADGAMQMHVRITGGGTLIVRDGRVKKVDLRRPGTISAGVYPAWHPSLPLIAYSNNLTHQNFHTADPNKIEVYDRASDLVLYDVDADRIDVISNDSLQLETFPAWSPDGTTLYYASASLPDSIVDNGSVQVNNNTYKTIRYNIVKRSFDPSTCKFSEPEMVYDAVSQGKSAVLPRVSPDGRFLLFSMAEYGTFHIWHHDADLYVLDLATGEAKPLTAANSTDTESYHSWSSNGRWILFSSRRDDGNYTRLYMAYFDTDGNVHTPFMLPQRDPQANIELYKSYNVPEFMVAPVEVTRSQLLDAINANIK